MDSSDPGRVTGKISGAVSLDGADDHLVVPYSADLAPTAAVSFGGWACRSVWAGYATDSRMLCKVESGGYRLGFNDSWYIGAGNVGAMVRRNGTYGVATASIAGLSNGWHHFVGTYDGRYTRFYVDGALVDTDDAGASYPVQYSFNNALILGGEAGSGSTADGYYFSGLIDDVRVYGRALSGAEMRELCQMGQ